MTQPLNALSSRCIDPTRTAIFLDFDGTLVEIAEHPSLVRLSPDTRRTLTQLYLALSGALAVITGREIGDVDRFLKPLHLPVGGVHGLKRRGADGVVCHALVNDRAISELSDRLHDAMADTEGLLIEQKSGAIALHYRGRPDLEQACVEAIDQAARDMDGIHLIRGKMVIEAKACTSDKGGAVEDFLSEPPFAGRMPVFAGDDVTDEDAFAVVNDRGGISIKVGPGPTRAHYRAGDISEFLDWLQGAAADLDRVTSVEHS
ncbi:MAG: trehalose-phosphatase [Hyphomicrobiales bacterium]|nr:trehalose-phosphatase [Hyphomicrobiales bacterium]